MTTLKDFCETIADHPAFRKYRISSRDDPHKGCALIGFSRRVMGHKWVLFVAAPSLDTPVDEPSLLAHLERRLANEMRELARTIRMGYRPWAFTDTIHDA